jgi:tripartite-type tricarboxylate transporter receptor subunit TctC
MKRREFITLLSAAAVAVVTVPLVVAGQDYPSRSITLIVNFPPGGSTDAMARIIREPLSQALGQSIIIDNRGGAGGTTGAAAVANARSDGYTLLLSVNSALTTNRYLQRNFPFDPKTAFAPITLTSDVAIVLAVHPSLPVHDVTELIEYAKKNPGKLAYVTPGIGSSHHVCGELLKQKVGIDMVHVPYRGGALAMQDLLAGNVKVGFSTLPVALPQAQAGGIRVIAVAEKTRLPELPDTPTIDETVRRRQRRLERPAGARRNAGADHRQAQCGGGGGAEDAGHHRQDEASGPAPTDQHAGGIRQPPRQRGRSLGQGHSVDRHSAGIAATTSTRHRSQCRPTPAPSGLVACGRIASASDPSSTKKTPGPEQIDLRAG